jgi:uncharacterized membrane protein
MTMRLQEVHPAVVHFPITLLPLAIGLDAIGRSTENPVFLEVGRRGIAVAALGAAVAGVTGLIAQEASAFDRKGRKLLVTHRTLNLGLIGLASLLAVRRARRERPGIPYLLAGAASVAAMSYSAYLGGHMVYEHGVGVRKARGIRKGEAPELRPRDAGDVLRTSGRQIARGVRSAARDFANGDAMPWLD